MTESQHIHGPIQALLETAVMVRPIREKNILHVNRGNYEVPLINLGSRISRFNKALFTYNEVIVVLKL